MGQSPGDSRPLLHLAAPAQAYVALSRARSLEGLQVTGLCSKAVKTSKTVLKFYQG